MERPKNAASTLRRHLTSVPASAILLLTLLFTCPAAQARVELKPCHNGLSPEQQVELGQKVVEKVYEQMPVLPDSSRVTQYVQSLGQRLVQQAPGYHWPYNFHVVNVADINAFALPGGAIFVNLGTIQAASNEAQLAAVLAHEISHVILQHSVCNLEKEKRVGLFAGLGQIASGLILGDTALGALAQKGIGLTAGLSFLRMGREAEQQADLEGVGMLYDAGYDPRAMPQFFETIQAKYGKGGAQFLSDHPNPGNRTEYVDKEISTFVPKTNYIRNSTDFNRIHSIVANMRAYTSKEVESGAWKRKDPNQTVSTGVNQYNPDTPPINHIDATPPQKWIPFQGSGFTLEVPANWQAAGNRKSAMIAPPGGISQSGNTSNLVYGVLTDIYRPDQSSSSVPTFDELISELTRENSGLEPGRIERVNLANTSAQSVQSINRNANGGRGEHDWIVGIPQSGAIRYFVFVSPEPDFPAMRPVFEHILNSIRFE